MFRRQNYGYIDPKRHQNIITKYHFHSLYTTARSVTMRLKRSKLHFITIFAFFWSRTKKNAYISIKNQFPDVFYSIHMAFLGRFSP